MENFKDTAQEIKTSLDSKSKAIALISDTVENELNNIVVQELELIDKITSSETVLDDIKTRLTRVKQSKSNLINYWQHVQDRNTTFYLICFFTLVTSAILFPLFTQVDSNNYQNYLKKSCNNSETKINLCYNMSDTYKND
ncbi:hypothetical protein NIES2100_05140 [Calothrix sp. NIES-2100]|uniref:hypothetical protein n=1 Tax=Calothrix sp. NIES-2100 TaxID=1954172 RepID=UPI000B5EB869|nr:hypothetical protein NIES2100_05140 [Calothrix sp. NIES-2100]